MTEREKERTIKQKPCGSENLSKKQKNAENY